MPRVRTSSVLFGVFIPYEITFVMRVILPVEITVVLRYFVRDS